MGRRVACVRRVGYNLFADSKRAADRWKWDSIIFMWDKEEDRRSLSWIILSVFIPFAM